jgi:hypothetical protein
MVHSVFGLFIVIGIVLTIYAIIAGAVALLSTGGSIGDDVRLIIEAPKNCWWYEMHIAGMCGQTIEVDGRPYNVVSAAPHDRDEEPMQRAKSMTLELRPATLREARDHW